VKSHSISSTSPKSPIRAPSKQQRRKREPSPANGSHSTCTREKSQSMNWQASAPKAENESPEKSAALKRSLTAYPDATLLSWKEFEKDRIDGFSTFLSLLYVLLALSIVVSLFGMVNTQVLSVFERTRELGMLRAVGMSRR
jgi:putative ABC transport system permease protein